MGIQIYLISLINEEIYNYIMSGLLNKLFGKKDKKTKYKIYEPTELKMIALKTRVILEKQRDMLLKLITQEDHKFKIVGNDPKQLYVLLRNIGQKVIQAESIKLYIEMIKKIETNSASIIQTNGDMTHLKVELFWFQSILWFRKSKEVTYLQDFNNFCMDFFKGVDITEEITINCEIFELYPVTKYLRKKDDPLPIKQILFYLQPYVSCSISQPTLETIFSINKEEVNRKSLQKSGIPGIGSSSINYQNQIPMNSHIQPTSSNLYNNISSNMNIQQKNNFNNINPQANSGNSLNIQPNNQFNQQFDPNSSYLPLNIQNQSSINNNSYNSHQSNINSYNNPIPNTNINQFNQPNPHNNINNAQRSQLIDNKGNVAYMNNNNNYNQNYPHNTYIPQTNPNNNNQHQNNNTNYNDPNYNFYANYASGNKNPSNQVQSLNINNTIDHNPFNSNPFTSPPTNNNINNNFNPNTNNYANFNINHNRVDQIHTKSEQIVIQNNNNSKKSVFSTLMRNNSLNQQQTPIKGPQQNQKPQIPIITPTIPPSASQQNNRKAIPKIQPLPQPKMIIPLTQQKKQEHYNSKPIIKTNTQELKPQINKNPIANQEQLSIKIQKEDIVKHQQARIQKKQSVKEKNTINIDIKPQQIQLKKLQQGMIKRQPKKEEQPQLAIDYLNSRPISQNNNNNTLNIQPANRITVQRQRQINDFQFRQSRGKINPGNRESQQTLNNPKNWKNKIKQWQQKQKRRKQQEEIQRRIEEQQQQRLKLINQQKKRQQQAQRLIQQQIKRAQQQKARIQQQQRRIRQEQQAKILRQNQLRRAKQEQQQMRIRQIQQNKRRMVEQQQRIERQQQQRQRQRKARIEQRQRQDIQNEIQFRFDVDNEREQIDRGQSMRFNDNMVYDSHYDDQDAEEFTYNNHKNVNSSLLRFKNQQSLEDKETQKQFTKEKVSNHIDGGQEQIQNRRYEQIKPINKEEINYYQTDQQQSIAIILSNLHIQSNPPFKLFFYKKNQQK